MCYPQGNQSLQSSSCTCLCTCSQLVRLLNTPCGEHCFGIMNNTKILLAQQVQMNMRRVCLDLKPITAFKYCFAQLAVISFEIGFVWKLSLTRLLTCKRLKFHLPPRPCHQTFTCPRAKQLGTNVYYKLLTYFTVLTCRFLPNNN